MTTREQFEALNPVPTGIAWNEQAQRYGLTVGRGTSIEAWEAYSLAWAAFRDSHKAEEGERG